MFTLRLAKTKHIWVELMYSIKNISCALFCVFLIWTFFAILNYSLFVMEERINNNVTRMSDPNLALPSSPNVTRISNPLNCALIFFGLPKSFKNIVLPSIEKYVLAVNPYCDIFIHTYNISEYSNPRNSEKHEKINTFELLSIENITNVVFENLDDFHHRINVSYYRKYFPEGVGWQYPNSLDNMIMQWNSIQVGWEHMVNHEAKINKRYRRVGLFRSDVLYTNNIDIQNGKAVTAKFNNMYEWTNDRLFFGLREYAQIWATKRFSFVDPYMKTAFGKKTGLHSEMFLYKLLTHWKIPLTLQDICFQRVRANGNIKLQDCNH